MPDKQEKVETTTRKIVDTVSLSMNGRTIRFHLLAVIDEHGLSEGVQIDAPGEKAVTAWGFPITPVVEAVGGRKRDPGANDPEDDFEDPEDEGDLTSAQEIRERLIEHAMKGALNTICQKIQK